MNISKPSRVSNDLSRLFITEIANCLGQLKNSLSYLTILILFSYQKTVIHTDFKNHTPCFRTGWCRKSLSQGKYRRGGGYVKGSVFPLSGTDVVAPCTPLPSTFFKKAFPFTELFEKVACSFLDGFCGLRIKKQRVFADHFIRLPDHRVNSLLQTRHGTLLCKRCRRRIAMPLLQSFAYFFSALFGAQALFRVVIPIHQPFFFSHVKIITN